MFIWYKNIYKLFNAKVVIMLVLIEGCFGS